MPNIDEELDEEIYIFPKDLTSIEDPLERAENIVFYLMVNQHHIAFAEMLESAKKLFTPKDLEQIQEANPELASYIKKDQTFGYKNKLQNFAQQLLDVIEKEARESEQKANSPKTVADERVLDKKENMTIATLKKQGAIKLPSATKVVSRATEITNNPKVIETKAPETVLQDQIIQQQSTLLVTDIDLSEYQKSTAEDIIKDNLIAVAAYQKNLEAVEFMANELHKKPDIKGVNQALDIALEELIRVVPIIYDQATIPRDAALTKLNDVRKQNSFNYNTIELSNPIIQDIIKQNNLDRFKLIEKRFEEAKNILKLESEQKIRVAQEAYDKEKDKAGSVSDKCLLAAQSIITNSALDLNDFDIKRLEHIPLKIQQNLKDTIFKIRGGEKAPEAEQTKSTKSQGKPSSINVRKFLNDQSSLEIEGEVNNYNQNVNNFMAITETYTTEQEKIKTKVIEEYTSTYQKTFQQVKALYEQGMGEFYQNMSEKEAALLNESREYKLYIETEKAIKEQRANLKDNIIAEVVIRAIKLNQLNESLDDPVYKLAANELQECVVRSSVAILKKIGIDCDLQTERRIAAYIKSPRHISEHALKEIPDSIEEKKNQMKELLNQLGIKEEVLTELTVAKAALQTAAKVKIDGTGVSIALPRRRPETQSQGH